MLNIVSSKARGEAVMSAKNGSVKLVAGNSNPVLAQEIAQQLGLPLTKAVVRRFADMEIFVEIHENVRGSDAFIIQSTSFPANDHLMELLIITDALRRSSARRITAVIPYFGYARQDRKTEGRTPITAKLLANLITAAGAHRVLAMDLHADQIQGFFDIPVDHLTAYPVIARHFSEMNLRDMVMVSPDVGHLKTTNRFAEILGGDIAIIDKRRRSGEDVEMNTIIGSVENRNVLLFDDMITTGGTLVSAARLVRDRGAKSVFAGATHGIFARDCAAKLRDAGFEQICVTDTVPVRREVTDTLPNLKVLSVARLLGEAVRRIHRNESVSALFRH
jgi:ribose-phosphate pyrophosphokinase